MLGDVSPPLCTAVHKGENHLEVASAQRARELLGFISQELSRSVTLTGQDLWCKSYFSFCKGRPCYLHGHGHWAPLPGGRNEVSSFGFCRRPSLSPQDHKVWEEHTQEHAFDTDLTQLLRRIPLGVAVPTWCSPLIFIFTCNTLAWTGGS